MTLLRTSTWVTAFLVLASSSSWAQTAAPNTPPGWKTYVNQAHGFSFAYPPLYKLKRRPDSSKDQEADARGGDMDKEAVDGRWVGLRNQSSDGAIDVTLENDRFDVDRFFAKHNTSAADSPAPPIQEGDNTFYFCGGGSMGGQYPDAFFAKFKGKTIYFVFDGPYDSNTPTDETKEIESRILASFRILGPERIR
jgi:hypothetical protein